jgi:hypothetical protein
MQVPKAVTLTAQEPGMTHLTSSRCNFFSRLCDHRSRFTSCGAVVTLFGGVVCLVKICDCLRVLCPQDWSFIRPLKDTDVSLSRIPLVGAAGEISVDSGSFLAFSSLDALETAIKMILATHVFITLEGIKRNLEIHKKHLLLYAL